MCILLRLICEKGICVFISHVNFTRNQLYSLFINQLLTEIGYIWRIYVGDEFNADTYLYFPIKYSLRLYNNVRFGIGFEINIGLKKD